MGLLNTIKFLTESSKSEDFGKTREDWQASKDAKKAAASGKGGKGGKGK